MKTVGTKPKEIKNLLQESIKNKTPVIMTVEIEHGDKLIYSECLEMNNSYFTGAHIDPGFGGEFKIPLSKIKTVGTYDLPVDQAKKLYRR